jgi:competence protein ComFC
MGLVEHAPLSSLAVGWPHAGGPADTVRLLKYRRRSAEVTVLADRMALLVPVTDLEASIDVVTWCPAHASNRRQRHFDQSELLARAVAHRIGRPCRRLLRRNRGVPQSTLDRAGRLHGPLLMAVGAPLRGRPRILLIDDVVTTGATLRTAAVVLRARGAGAVHAVVATRAVPRRARWPASDDGPAKA